MDDLYGCCRPVAGMEMRNLYGLAGEAVSHWKRFRPKLYRELKASGKLQEAAERAAEQTAEDLALLISQGYPEDGAWEIVRERYVFLPSQRDVPELGVDPNYVPDPSILASTPRSDSVLEPKKDRRAAVVDFRKPEQSK